VETKTYGECYQRITSGVSPPDTVTDRWAYFDNAAVAPLSKPAREAIGTWASDSADNGDMNWPSWAQRIEQVRTSVAELIGAESEEIALVPNTTAGLSIVAEGFPWKEGDNVVLPDGEFPSNVYPWMNLLDQGVEARRVVMPGPTLEIDRLLAACDQRTRIVAASWVGYSAGWRTDVAQLAQAVHDRGALLVLDAIQGLGVFPLDVKETGVDFVAADGHKWMLGPEGAGIFYMRREHLDLLRPFGVGWNSVVQRHDFSHIAFDFRNEAARYEGGSQNMPGFMALGASLDLLSQLGLSKSAAPLADAVLEITDELCQRLSSAGATLITERAAGHESGIVSFEIPGHDPKVVRQRCIDADIILSCRSGRLRVSAHAYNDSTDVDRLIDVLNDF